MKLNTKFENIIGQDIAVRSLKNIIAQDQVKGSYLFLGPDGVGKRSSSIEFAKAINCENREKENIDCTCTSCNKIDSMNHPDVFMIYPEGVACSIKIGKIREIIYQASLKPYEGKKGVFVINDAETMTEEAQNALLKLLEDPPQNHILILTAFNILGLLATIISRCRVLKFYSLTENRIEEFLKGLRDFDEKDALLFSHMAMGSLGRALEFKEKNIIQRREEVVNDFFLRKSALLQEGVLNKYIDDDIEESLHMLLCWYRDLLVAKFSEERHKLLNIDRCEEIVSYSGKFSKEKLEQDVLNILDTIEYIRRNLNPKIALFNMAVQLKRG